MRTLSQARLKEVLRYDEVTGDFIWISKYCAKVVVGSKAGADCNGYRTIKIDGQGYYAHRLAWLYMTGVFPDEVDHENRVKSDNRWMNLRLATRGQNESNKSVSKANTSGVKGVHWAARDKRWIARIEKDGLCHTIGRFKLLADAKAAIESARSIIHGDFASD